MDEVSVRLPPIIYGTERHGTDDATAELTKRALMMAYGGIDTVNQKKCCRHEDLKLCVPQS